MAILREMFAQRSSGQSTLTDLQPFVTNAFGGQPAASGISVTEDSSLQVTAVYACVRLLAGALASLPLHVNRRTKNGKERAVDHPLYPLLHDQPNPEMTSVQWREAGMCGVLLWGNAFSAIDLDKQGNVAALYPITPSRARPYRDRDTREILYEIFNDQGAPMVISSSQMIHVPALGYDGLTGKSPIGLMREAIGLAAVTERHGAAFFGKGAQPGITLEHPKSLSPKAVRTIKEMWIADHGTIDKAHDVSVLGEGMTASSFNIDNDHAQFLETRRFQVSEIARIFGVPSWMINDSDAGTAWPSAIDAIGMIFVVHVLRPWLVKWEQAMNSKFFTQAEQDRDCFIEFDVNGLMRGDAVSRFQSYASALTNGWMSRNEVRQLENLNRVDGLDEFETPSGGNAMKPVTGNPRDAQRAFAPLFNETWARIFRRERNDRPAAEKKGQLVSWLEQHLAYAREQLDIVVEAYRAAGGECLSAAELVSAEYTLATTGDLDPITRAEAATERALRNVR